MAKVKPSASEVLRAAADKIAQPGCWTRNWSAFRWVDPSDHEKGQINCLGSNPAAIMWGGVGVIYAIGKPLGLSDQECWAIQGVAAKAVGVERFSDWAWAPERTQAEVVQALRSAAP